MSVDHVLPFQCRIIPCCVPPLMLGMLNPTAYTSPADRAATALSAGYPPGVGLLTMLQAEPSQCSIRVVRPRPGTSSLSPTAQTSFEATAVTPCRTGLLGPLIAGCGRIVTAQVVPLKCSAYAELV